MGCQITLTLQNQTIEKIEGYTCKRGKTYAKKEITNPTRIVTSTVNVNNGDIAMLSVKTREAVPKAKIAACMAELRGLSVNAPIEIGAVIIKNCAETGIDIVATKAVEQDLKYKQKV